MADNGKSKKAGRSQKGDFGKLTTAKHRRRRIKREEERQALCKQAREWAGDKLNGVQRAIRQMRRARGAQ